MTRSAGATRALAARAEALNPDLATTAFIVEDRGGKVFVDSIRAGGATVAAAYSPRLGTVTLIGISSRAVSFGSAAMDQLWGVDISGGSVERGNLTPDREAIGHHLSVVGRRQQVPTDPEMWRNAAERRQEPLGMAG